MLYKGNEIKHKHKYKLEETVLSEGKVYAVQVCDCGMATIETAILPATNKKD